MGKDDIIYDDTCLRCDAWDITLTFEPNRVDYLCRECGYVWSSEEEELPTNERSFSPDGDLQV